ncbi:unnamed protein product, partial [Eruca vesicaria subsp. sativa]|nr:unnamed protein product [Eruca vesicaria subsp. sativa]
DLQSVDLANKLAPQYNARLKESLSKRRTLFYANVYDLRHGDLIVNYNEFGFRTACEACCGTEGRLARILTCGPTSSLCKDRSKHVFWNPYHPSEAAKLISYIIADKLLYGMSLRTAVYDMVDTISLDDIFEL